MSNDKVSKLEELLATYDDSVLDLVHEHMQQNNNDVREIRIDGHPNTQAVIDRAHALLNQANRMGQIYITEHHTGSPRIFFTAGTTVNMWEKGETSKKFIGKNSHPLRSLTFSSYEGADGKNYEFVHFLLDNNTIQHQQITPGLGYYQQQIPGTVIYDIVYNNYDAYYLTSEGLAVVEITFNHTKEQTIIHHGHRNILIPGGFKEQSRIEPRMTLDAAKKHMYIMDQSRGIIMLDLNSKKPTPIQIFTLNQLASPVSIAFDEEQRLLLIHDSTTQKIYAHSVDAKSSYPAFANFGQHLTFPSESLQSGAQFTFSCWLKTDGVRSKNWEDQYKDKLLGFHFSQDENYLVFQYIVDGKPVSETLYLGNLQRDSWFHFAWVKRGREFEFFIDGKTIGTTYAPELIDTSRRIPNNPFEFNFSVPGYLASEIRLWNVARAPSEIKDDMKRWVTNQPEIETLSGYWRPEVNNGDSLWKSSDPAIKDLSGHGNHCVGKSIQWKMETSPLDKLIPIYPTNSWSRPHQGFTVDSPLNHIYWVENQRAGNNLLMRGSTLGHLPTTPVAHVPNNTADIHAVSGSNNSFEELVIAHKKRRDAFQKMIQDISHQFESGHQNVIKNHTTVSNAHGTADDHAQNAPNNREERNEVNELFAAVIDEMHITEKTLERESADRRIAAIARAQEIVSNAHLEASRIRRETGERLLAERRKK